MSKADHIIEFYGETCPHCVIMRPIVEGIEKDLKITIQKLEVWNSEKNFYTSTGRKNVRYNRGYLSSTICSVINYNDDGI